MHTSLCESEEDVLQIYRSRGRKQQYNGLKTHGELPLVDGYMCYICQKGGLHLFDFDLSDGLFAMEKGLRFVEGQHRGCRCREVFFGGINLAGNLKEMRFYRSSGHVETDSLVGYLKRVFVHHHRLNFRREAEQLLQNDPVVHLNDLHLGNLSELVQVGSDIGLA